MTSSNRSAISFVGVLAALFLVVGVAVAVGGNGGSPTPAARHVALGKVRLVSTSSCDDLLTWFRATAAAEPAAFGGGPIMYANEEDRAVASGAGAAVPGAAATPPSAAKDEATSASTDHSDTNVQERGVDEPDIVKTNGKVLVDANGSALEILAVGDGAPRLLSTVALDQGQTELLLSGDRVLALTTVFRGAQGFSPGGVMLREGQSMPAMSMPIRGQQSTVLTSIDISDPSLPRVIDRREVDGAYRTARATGTTARVVLDASPRIPDPGPDVYDSQDPTVVQQRIDAWRTQAIASMTLRDWAPAASDDCTSIVRTSTPEGLGTTTILTLDLQDGLRQLDSDTIVADTAAVYASTNRLYLATSRWNQEQQPNGKVSTELHAFDTSSATTTTYVGSGSVDGYLLNQWSLSERDGHLRVATTQQAPWDPQTGEEGSTVSSMTVLDERGPALVEVGRLDGLGVSERIQAVRFVGDTAYVVTFHQRDPLFAIDLSDPSNPRLAGELKIPGYSAYLHPIDDGRLLGVGQDATDTGETLGTQLATFDVHDAASPTRIDAKRIDHASSTVEYDPRAFLWWAATRTVVLPIEVADLGGVGGAPACPPNAACAMPAMPEPSSPPFAGAVAFTIGTDGSITELGRVTHAGRGADTGGYHPIVRSLVVGDALYTVSDAGVLASSLSTLADEGFAPLPTPPNG